MFNMLTWGYEAPSKSDYTKGGPREASAQHQIKKTSKQWLSENHDNFRKFLYNEQNPLFNYADDGFKNQGKEGDENSLHYETMYEKAYGPSRSQSPVKYGEEGAILGGDQGIFDTNLDEDENASGAGVLNGKRGRGSMKGGEGGDEDGVLSNGKSGGGLKKKRKTYSAKPKYTLKNREKRIQKLNETTRWLPDSAFTTFFGKPAFHAYGKGNTNPTYGGPVYGTYMLSHNINAESGNNNP